jgi:hypothetical protein
MNVRFKILLHGDIPRVLVLCSYILKSHPTDVNSDIFKMTEWLISKRFCATLQGSCFIIIIPKDQEGMRPESPMFFWSSRLVTSTVC